MPGRSRPSNPPHSHSSPWPSVHLHRRMEAIASNKNVIAAPARVPHCRNGWKAGPNGPPASPERGARINMVTAATVAAGAYSLRVIQVQRSIESSSRSSRCDLRVSDPATLEPNSVLQSQDELPALCGLTCRHSCHIALSPSCEAPRWAMPSRPINSSDAKKKGRSSGPSFGAEVDVTSSATLDQWLRCPGHCSWARHGRCDPSA